MKIYKGNLYIPYNICMSILLLSILVAIVLSGDFQPPQTGTLATECTISYQAIPHSFLENVFGSTFSDADLDGNFNAFLQDPTTSNLHSYLFGVAPYALPLFGFAGLTVLLFIGCVIQVCCFQVCGVQCCGNNLNSLTYSTCVTKCIYVCFIVLTTAIIVVSGVSIMLNSGLSNALSYTNCNLHSIINETFQGSANTSTPWSGISNIGYYGSMAATNLINSLPYLQSYFNASNLAFTQLTQSNSNSLYFKATTFNCLINNNLTLDCPYSDDAICPNPLQPTFYADYCDGSMSNSAKGLISSQINQNTSQWKTSLEDMAGILIAATTKTDQINFLASTAVQFSADANTYESQLQQSFSVSSNIISYIYIALYAIYSLILSVALIGLVATCNIFCCRCYASKLVFPFVWVALFLFTVLIFILSGITVASSIVSKNACAAYPYYLQNKTNFNTLQFSSSKAGQIIEDCFFNNGNNILQSFQNQGTYDLEILVNTYQNLNPAPQFQSIVTQIQNNLRDYSSNPNLITFVNQTDSNSAQHALDLAISFANYSLSNTTQTDCKITKDYPTFNSANCNFHKIGQPIGQDNCLVISNQYNIQQMMQDRWNIVNTSSTSSACKDAWQDYNQTIYQLLAYKESVASMVNFLSPISYNSTNKMQAYETNYYAYYSLLNNFMNEVNTNFDSFIDSSNQLQNNASCVFIKDSLDKMASVTCTQMIVYVRVYAVLSIVLASLMLLALLLAYLLPTRAQFFKLIGGDFNRPVQLNKIVFEHDNFKGNHLLLNTSWCRDNSPTF